VHDTDDEALCEALVLPDVETVFVAELTAGPVAVVYDAVECVVSVVAVKRGFALTEVVDGTADCLSRRPARTRTPAGRRSTARPGLHGPPGDGLGRIDLATSDTGPV